MISGSRRYKELEFRLQELQQRLLSFIGNPPASKLSYSPTELDFTRAYVVLAHAEIETFCEEIAIRRVNLSKAKYDRANVLGPVLRKLVFYHVAKKGRSWQDILNPPSAIINSACIAYTRVVRDNHGIKRKNLENILFPIGIHDAHLNPTWLAQMDSFGVKRGELAHRSSRAQQPPDPLSQLSAVQHLIPGLLDLDQQLSRL